MILDEIYSRAANTLDMVPAGGAASSPIERANVGEVVGSPKRGGGWAADVVSGVAGDVVVDLSMVALDLERRELGYR